MHGRLFREAKEPVQALAVPNSILPYNKKIWFLADLSSIVHFIAVQNTRNNWSII